MGARAVHEHPRDILSKLEPDEIGREDVIRPHEQKVPDVAADERRPIVVSRKALAVVVDQPLLGLRRKERKPPQPQAGIGTYVRLGIAQVRQQFASVLLGGPSPFTVREGRREVDRL
jgi:hypothetical protein